MNRGKMSEIERQANFYAHCIPSRALSFCIFSNEGQEPPHIHIKADRDQAKFWLEPIALASNYGFKAHELNEIERIIQERQVELLEAWHEHLG